MMDSANTPREEQESLSCVYAALILHDGGVEITVHLSPC